MLKLSRRWHAFIAGMVIKKAKVLMKFALNCKKSCKMILVCSAQKKHMKEGFMKLEELKDRLNYAIIKDKSECFNTARIEALELDNLMATAIATAYCG